MWSQWRRWIAYPLAWLALMLIPMGWMAFRHHHTAPHASSDFTVRSFDATYTARRSGDQVALAVVERIAAEFPPWSASHGIERQLPATYDGHPVGLSDIKVTDPQGKAMPTSVRTADNGDPIMRIGSADTYVHGTVTYVISYQIAQAMIRDSGGRQEIYLDTNGTGWHESFNHVRATLVVPPDLAGRLDGTMACYQGALGATNRCDVRRTATGVMASADNLDVGHNMTFAVGFQPGTTASAIPLAGRGGASLLQIAALPLGALVLLGLVLVARWLLQRRGNLAASAPVAYTPPEGIPAIAAADLLNVPDRGAAAELAELVVQQVAVISSAEEPVATAPHERSLNRQQRSQYREKLYVTVRDIDRLPRSERPVVTAMFGDGTRREIGQLRDFDVEEATRERAELFAGLGLVRDVRGGNALLILGMIAAIGYGWVLLYLGVVGTGWYFFAAGLLAVVALIAALHYFPQTGRLSDKGQRVMTQLLGLRRFVTMAEADRIAWLQNAVDAPRLTERPQPGDATSRTTDQQAATSVLDIYEPLLPYAIIFGAEKTWTQVLGSRRVDTLPPLASPALLDAISVDSLGQYRWYDDRTYRLRNQFWSTRPEWGEGWISRSGRAWSVSRQSNYDSGSGRDNDEGRGGFFSGRSSHSSSGSGKPSGGSSGGGFSGGGMGGGGGGGW